MTEARPVTGQYECAVGCNGGLRTHAIGGQRTELAERLSQT